MGLDRDGSYPCAAAETEGSRRATGALRAASAGLQQALAASDAAGALALLDGLATLLRDNPPEEFCADSLAEACLASSAAMTQERPVSSGAKPAPFRRTVQRGSRGSARGVQRRAWGPLVQAGR